jgi:glycine cleavage system H protein
MKDETHPSSFFLHFHPSSFEVFMVPKNLRFAETHEWASIEGDICTIGITKFAVDQLTDLVFIEMKKAGKTVAVKEAVGQVESVKSVNDIYAPVAGEIVAKNEAIEKDTAIVTADPYGKGWMVKIKMSSKADFDKLLTPEQYEKQIASQGH